MMSLGRLSGDSLPFDAHELYDVLARLAARAAADWAGDGTDAAVAALEMLREPARTATVSSTVTDGDWADAYAAGAAGCGQGDGERGFVMGQLDSTRGGTSANA